MKSVYTLSLKIWLLFILCSFIMLWGLVSWKMHEEFDLKLYEIVNRTVVNDMARIQGELEHELQEGHDLGFEQVLTSITSKTHYQILTAIDDRGHILYATGMALKGQQIENALPDFEPQRFEQVQRNHRTDIRFDVKHQRISAYAPFTMTRMANEIRQVRTGVVFAIYDLNEDHTSILHEFMHSSLQIGLLLMLVATILVAGFLYRFVTLPLQHLIRTILDVAKGELIQHNPVRGHGEFALLGQTISNMSVQLDERLKLLEQAKEKLQTSEERWQFALKGNRDGVWDWNVVSNEVFFSRRWIEMLGYDESLIGNDLDAWKQRIHPDDREQVFVDVNRHFNGETEYYESEHRLLCMDGSYKWVLSRGKVVSWTDDHKPQRMIGTQTDIADRKQAEEKLLKYASIVSASNDMMALIDTEYRILVCNKQYSTAFGKEPDEITNKTIEEVWEGKVFNEIIKNKADLCLTGREINYQYEFNFPSLGKRYMDVYYYPYYDDSNNVTGYVVNARDITRRKQTEAALRESEEIFSVIASNASDAIIVLNSETRVSFWNAAAEQIFGYAVAEAMGKKLGDLIVPESLVDAHNKGIEAFLKSGDFLLKNNPIELEARSKAGSTLHIELSLGKAMIDNKLCVIGILRDISKRKTSEMRLRRLERSLKSLVQINQTIIYASTEDVLLTRTCESLVETGNYILAWIGYVEEDENKTVRPVAQYGFDEAYIKSLDVSWADGPRGQGPIGKAIRNKEVCLARDIENNPEFIPRHERVNEFQYKSFIAVPLFWEERVMGTINIYSAFPDVFDNEEIALLQNLSSNVAFGIHDQRLLLEKYDYSAHLEKSLIDTIGAIAITVEKRDPYTSGHMKHVSELAVLIAKEMGLSSERIKGLELGASIHDIGKIYIPAEILNRPGKLTAAEFELIKSHSQVGYDIIKGINFPWPVAEIILQHHEKLDGSGYPNGLQGDQIILEAQILTVADIVEAITAHRPYRPALEIDKGIDVIQDGRRKYLNPEAVDACIKVIKKGDFSFD